MINVMSRPPVPSQSPSVTLLKIWDVDVDSSYCVDNFPYDAEPLYVAIRTFEGEGRLVTTKAASLSLEKNTLVILNRSHIKTYHAMKNGWRFIFFNFNAEPGAIPKLNTIHNIGPLEGEIDNLRKCCELIRIGNPLSPVMASALFGYMLVCWKQATDKTHMREMDRLEKIISYLNRNDAGNVTITELAARFGMAERTLRKSFRDFVGVSPKRYIAIKKMNSAMEMLRYTSMQVKEISLTLGFQNQYYFSRAFKKEYGQPPSFYLHCKEKGLTDFYNNAFQEQSANVF